MKSPIGVRVDFETTAGYVQYAATPVVGTLDVWENGTVAADLDADRCVVGIEVLGLDDEALSVARDFAHDRGLRFPENLAGVLAVA
jgi:hypothetical protein